MKWLPKAKVGKSSAPMFNEDDGDGYYLLVEWLGACLIIEIVRRAA